jgi:hypothetical protein
MIGLRERNKNSTQKFDEEGGKFDNRFGGGQKNICLGFAKLGCYAVD